ncbi:MAG: polysaccharide pyruvyl transferase family protein [Rhodobacterales bacterium]|nr:polysaccharide pyruvyl transferase family protein [Rhodobacterales bacterium]
MTAAPRVLLVNDTDEGATHFGCMRVMRTIRAELARRGMPDLPSIKVGTDWRRDAGLTARIDAADVVVINGEGTLHHGKRRGRWLLEAGARVKARGGRVALINALWQDNPGDWADLAGGFDILACRDGHSAGDLAKATGREVTCLGDLSMFLPWDVTSAARSGVMVGCSVHGEVTEALARFARQGGHDFVPVTTEIKSMPARLTGWRRWLRARSTAWRNHRFQARFPETRFLSDDLGFLTELSRHKLAVTGRFHAVCLAVLSGTPFIAVSSNSWKIEALIKDIGLDPDRLRALSGLTQATLAERDWDYSDTERAAIDASLSRWRETGAVLFDRIAALTPDRSI